MAEILKIPERPRPTESNASVWQIWRGRLKESVGYLLNKIGVPGVIGDVDIDDGVTGQRIQVRTGRFFTRLSVNGRDYYFRRLTGRFDGTGMGCG